MEWKMENGKTILVQDMTEAHAENCIWMLVRKHGAKIVLEKLLKSVHIEAQQERDKFIDKAKESEIKTNPFEIQGQGGIEDNFREDEYNETIEDSERMWDDAMDYEIYRDSMH